MNQLKRILLALATLAAPLCARADFTYEDFSSVTGLQLNGDAAQFGKVLRLTPSSGYEDGSVFTTQETALGNLNSFSTYFQFQMTAAGGISDSDGPGADGLTFVIQTVSNNVGSTGGGLGYAGITPSLGIEFDTYQNSGDPNGNHVGVDLNGSLTSIATANESERFNDGQIWNVWVDYDGTTNTLEVRWSLTPTKPTDPQLKATVNLTSVFGQDTGFVGFTAATGSGYENHDILTWQYSNTFFPPMAPAITSSASAAGEVGKAFTYQITAAHTPTTYGATGLPAGLSIDYQTGLITGTPTQAGTSAVTLSATNAIGTGTEALTLTVTVPPVVAPVIDSVTASTGQEGAPFAYQVTAQNSPSSYGATGLPAGVSINANSGILSGTPAVNGTFSVDLTASNAAGTGTATLVITISAAANDAPFIDSVSSAAAQEYAAFSYQISAGNAPVTYGASGLPNGLSVDVNSGAIAGTPSQSGVFGVCIWAVNGSGTGTAFLILTVTPNAVTPPVIDSVTGSTGLVGSPFFYEITAGNAATSFSADNLPDGLSVDLATGLISGTPTQAGVYTIDLGAANAGGTGSASLTLTVTASDSGVPGVSGATAATAQIGTSFVYQIVASNAPTSYSASGLPPGLIVDATTGVISGAANQLGTFQIGLAATNAGGTGTGYLTLTVTAVSAPVISSVTEDTAQFGLPYLYLITASNHPTSYSAAGLPPGLIIDTTNGVISGVPTQTGTFAIAVSATNTGGATTIRLNLVVAGDNSLVVTLAATKSSVTLGSGGIGEFTVTLSAVQTSDLFVNYTIKGSGENGVDYVLLSGVKKIKAGKISRHIKVIPQGDLGGASKKTVVLILAPGTGYKIGTAGKVKVKILGN